MAKKAIAALLLVTIAAWAEISLAPMLAMHAGHMRPGHEMAADMPMHHSGHQQAVAGERTCCPGLHKMEVADVLEVVSGSPACDDPHSCCFRQGPQSVPAPVRTAGSGEQRLAQDLMAATAAVNAACAETRRAINDSAPALRPPPEVFGMALRV